jgi:transcriptional regulator with XRE-family HTH domain
MDTFGDWLNDELTKRGWPQAELARRARVSRTSISDVISGKAKIGANVAKSIANALTLPEEEVFRQANILPKADPVNDYASRLAHRIAQLPVEEQEILDTLIDGLYKKQMGKRRHENGTTTSSPNPLPAED